MNIKLTLLILSVGMINLVSAKNIPQCSTSTPNNSECMTMLDNLHPGQPDVGMYIVNIGTPEKSTLENFVNECNNSLDDLDDDILDRGSSKSGIAGIMDKNGIIYLINGHHHTYALNELSTGSNNKCKYTGYVYVYIVDNQSKLDDASFKKYMLDNNLVWLHNNRGLEITYDHLPTKLSEMGNSPYRSLIKLVEDSKCNSDNPVIDVQNTTSYIELIWADRLYENTRDFINIGSSNAETYAVNSYNYIVNHFDKFADLPGAIKPKNDVCKHYD